MGCGEMGDAGARRCPPLASTRRGRRKGRVWGWSNNGTDMKQRAIRRGEKEEVVVVARRSREQGGGRSQGRRAQQRGGAPLWPPPVSLPPNTLLCQPPPGVHRLETAV